MGYTRELCFTRSQAIEYFIDFFKTCSGLHYKVLKENGFVTIEFQEPELKEFTVTTLIFENKFYEELKKEITTRTQQKTLHNAKAV